MKTTVHTIYGHKEFKRRRVAEKTLLEWSAMYICSRRSSSMYYVGKQSAPVVQTLHTIYGQKEFKCRRVTCSSVFLLRACV